MGLSILKDIADVAVVSILSNTASNMLADNGCDFAAFVLKISGSVSIGRSLGNLAADIVDVYNVEEYNRAKKAGYE